MRRLIDFKKYRNSHYLGIAIVNHCNGWEKSSGRLIGFCPRLGCNIGMKCFLRQIKRSGIAYCCNCRCAMDALEIVKVSMGTDYYTAADELDKVPAPS